VCRLCTLHSVVLKRSVCADSGDMALLLHKLSSVHVIKLPAGRTCSYSLGLIAPAAQWILYRTCCDLLGAGEFHTSAAGDCVRHGSVAREFLC
jgi:CelD/BcsL family acetyltransferase involved in cellulose biosynthesis